MPIGPHRDDFRLALRGEEARFSQGEFRAASVGLPVLILDDLYSELDPTIQVTLMEYLSGLLNQSFIITTHWTEGLCPAPVAVRGSPAAVS